MIYDRPLHRRRFLLGCAALVESARAQEGFAENALKALRRAQQRAGGAERLGAVRDVVRKLRIRGLSTALSAEQTLRIVVPDVFRQESKLPFGMLVVFASGDEGWALSPQGQTPLPEPQRRQARGELFRLRETLLLSDRDSGRKISFVERSGAGELEADVIEISDGDESVRLWIAVDEGETLKAEYDGVALRGEPARIEERYSDFREVGGLRSPFQVTLFSNGEPLTETVVEGISYNNGLTREQLSSPSPSPTP